MNVHDSEQRAGSGDGQSKVGHDIARVGPGTLGGTYLRQFWMPVFRSEDLPPGKAKPIRRLGENFAIYRGHSGKAQVIDYHCPHRRAPLHLGWVEDDDIRCMYHGWKFDCSGQCVEQPAEEAGFARKVKVGSYPTEEFLGLVYAYFGDGPPPAFPPYPAPAEPGFTENPPVDPLPCNYLQSYENSFDEVHVSFAHRTGGSHEGMYELPEISSEETDWGVIRYGTRKNGDVRISLHYLPNCTRVIVPPMAGLKGAGGWREIYLCFTPIDDESQQWFVINHVRVTGKEADDYIAARDRYLEDVKDSGSPQAWAMKAIAGELDIHDFQHPELVRVQDAAMMMGQGAYADRSRERLGKSDSAIILLRKIMERELSAIAEDRPTKQWTPAPADVVPTFGF